MTRSELKKLIETAEISLSGETFVVVCAFERDGRTLEVAITERLRKKCRKAHVWKSKEFLSAFKNAEYGFDEKHAYSPGGKDGIFVLTRDYRPKNNMMRKLFNHFIDHPESGVHEIAERLGVHIDTFVPVRLVSHHMRLLGILSESGIHRTLVLVDYDDT